MRRLTVLAVLTPSLSEHGWECRHDEQPHEHFRYASQQYTSDGHRRRSLQAGGTHQPLRIHIESSAVGYVADTIIPAAVVELTRALAVVPVAGSLLADPYCANTYEAAATCHTAAAPMCGLDAAGNERSVDASYLRGIRTCGICFVDGSCDEGTCSTSADGAGVSDADFVLVVSAVSTAACSGGNTLAYAGTCIRDQYDRPIFGFANFCPAAISSAAEDEVRWEARTRSLDTLCRSPERLCLGLCRCAHARSPHAGRAALDGRARAAPRSRLLCRELGALSRRRRLATHAARPRRPACPYECHVHRRRECHRHGGLGEHDRYEHGARPHRPSPRHTTRAGDFARPLRLRSNRRRQPRGSADHRRLVLRLSLGAAALHERCISNPNPNPNLKLNPRSLTPSSCAVPFSQPLRMPLPILPRSLNTPSRLPPSLLVAAEMMASTSSHAARFSALTLAALEDSGWYRANYSAALPLLWGRTLGCAFARGECVDDGHASAGFCNSSDADVPATWGCTPDHHSLGQCNLAAFPGALPPEYQRFGDGTLGGAMEVADYCPFHRSYTRAGGGSSHCDVASNVPERNFRAESYGPSSLCFESTLLQPIVEGGTMWSVDSPRHQGCHVMRCGAGGAVEIEVQQANGTTRWLACPSPGAYVAPPPAWGIDGFVRCPMLSTLLCDAHACPGLPCDATRYCQAGICTCDPDGAPPAFGVPCSGPAPANPPTVPSPRAPPPAPASPGGGYITAVRFEATIAGTVGDFDADAYAASLATFLSAGAATVAASDISLAVTPASVRVVSTIVASDASVATSFVAAIAAASPTDLSSALSVAVQSVGVPATVVVPVGAPRPPPSPPSQFAESASSTASAVMLAAILGGMVLITIGGFVCIIWLRKRRPRKEADTDISESPHDAADEQNAMEV